MAKDAQQVDLVVVGLGPGGEALATATAQSGLRVVAVDKHLVGGECPYFGCVPTKMMVAAATALREAGRVRELAGSAAISSSWAPVARRIREQATDDWDDDLTYDEAIAQGLQIMDQTAFTLCSENKLPMVVFGMETEGNILRAAQGEKIGTLVHAS